MSTDQIRPSGNISTKLGFYVNGGATSKDGSRIVRPELFDEEAKKIAGSFSSKNDRGYLEGVGATQLRRIFDEVKRFDQLLQAGPEQWEKQLPYIKMVKSKIRYTVARATKNKSNLAKYYKNLADFIANGVDQIENRQDYEVFLALFEAVYGFYYENAPNE
jgi:CRISPR-associated protein Csm2